MNETLRIEYCDSQNNVSVRDIIPRYLQLGDFGRLYLYAVDITDHRVKSFRVDRILDVRTLDEFQIENFVVYLKMTCRLEVKRKTRAS